MIAKKISRALSFLFLATSCLLFIGCEETWDTIDPENFQTWEYFTTQNGLGSDSVTCLAEDKEGNIWVGTLDNGVSKYDGREWTIYNEESGLLNNKVWCIAEDGHRNIWIGTNEGLSILNRNGNWYNDASFECVFALKKDYYDHMWISSDHYFTLEWDLQKWISWFDEEHPWCNYVDVLFEDRERNIWFGTWCGLKKITRDRSITYYNTDNGFPGGLVRSMYQDHWGNIWIGVSWANFVIRFNNRSFEPVFLSNGYSLNYISSISSDNEQNLWFAAYERGAVKFNGSLMKTYTVKDGLPGNIITTILRDRNNYLWFGTMGGGVACYMPGLD
jgi:ligand-binding sensor domain-containing protein